MKVGLLTLPAPWGGTEVHTANLARALKARGHSASVICLSQESYEAYRQHCGESVDLVLQPAPKEPYTMSFPDWLRFFSGQPWELCIFVKGHFGMGTWQLDLAARCAFGNYLTIEHLRADELAPKLRRRFLGIVPRPNIHWYRLLFRKFIRSVGPRRVVCVSGAVRSRLIEDYHFPARKVITVRNGIDAQRFSPDAACGEVWRQRWGIPSGALVFGALGRFAAMKGYQTALTGFQALLKRFPERNLWLVLAGKGEEEAALRTQAGQIVPGGKTVFAPFCDQPWEALNALDVFLMPSLNEGLPLALLEAMSCGRCAIASAAGGIPEVLTSPELGWLVPAGDVDAFGAAMIEAAQRTPEQRAAMGARAREHVQAHFNAAVQFNVLVDALESLGWAPRLRREWRLPAPAQL